MGGAWTRSRPWRRGLWAVAPRPSTTPFTFWYLVILVVTTVVLEIGADELVDRLLRWSSTDAHNLRHHPVLALVTSALWLPDLPSAAEYLLVIAVLIGALERGIGTGRVIAVFASGHIAATLATELPVVWAIRAHVLPADDGRWLDIGVSYGVFACIGVALLLLPARARWVLAVVVGSYLLVQCLETDPASLDAVITTAGHLLSALIGVVGWWPWLRRRGLIGSARPPGTSLSTVD